MQFRREAFRTNLLAYCVSFYSLKFILKRKEKNDFESEAKAFKVRP